MIYHPGERVALVHTDDQDTTLRHGDQGTVRQHDEGTHTVEVDWDNGSRRSMALNAGDRIRRVTDPATVQLDGAADGAGNRGWQQVLDTVRAAGAESGRNAAEWWAQDTIGGRAGGDVAATSRRILAGIEDGDPAVLDGLPSSHSGDGADGAEDADVYTATAGSTAAAWATLNATQRDAVNDAYRDAFDSAVENEVTARCRTVAGPTSEGRNLSHLHPDRLRIGSVGVFAGDWAWAKDNTGEWRIPVGFVGTLVDTWNGWAVFTCTRHVAEAIVADQQHQRDLHRQGLRERGVAEADLDARLDAELAALSFDGDTIVADQRGLSGDPEAIERITPDLEGRYVVMGRNWCWQAIDPGDCDRIVGDLPNEGEQQEFVVLPHTGMRVPHDRFRVTSLARRSTHNGEAFTASLQIDGQPAGTIVDEGNGGGSELNSTNTQFGGERMAAYARDSRHYGGPVSEQQMLDALVAEYDLGVRTGQADEGGGVLVRLVDERRNILHLQPVWPAPEGHLARVNLGRHLNTVNQNPAGAVWEVWSGTAWRYLTHATAPTSRTGPNAGGESEANPIRVFAFVNADALLEQLTREQLATHDAQDGIPLDPAMTEDQVTRPADPQQPPNTR